MTRTQNHTNNNHWFVCDLKRPSLWLEMYNIKQAYASRIHTLHCTLSSLRRTQWRTRANCTPHLLLFWRTITFNRCFFFAFKSVLQRKIFRANRCNHTRRRQETQPVVFRQNARACFSGILFQKVFVWRTTTFD